MMGRPRKEIDRDQFEKLCSLQCTEEDIAGWFDVSVDTIERFCKREYDSTFADVFAKKRVAGLISLRKAGFDLAKKNASVHIFYAKNYLGMRDSITYENGGNGHLAELIEGLKDPEERESVNE
jgi:hypothetical protein